jgi:hypothetical protein
MNTKHRTVGIGLIMVLLIVTTLGSIGWYIARPQSKALANNANIQLSVPKQDLNEPSKLAAQVENRLPKSQTLNGITVELTSAKMIRTGIQIGICYPTPDNGDWYPTPGNLTYGTYEIPPDEFEFTSEVKADGVNTGKRCVLIRYRIDEMENITTPMQVALTGYWAVPRELPPCENLMQRISTNPKAQAYGLKAKCSYDEQTGISVTLSEKAFSIAQDKAQQALDEIVKGEVNGPWLFTINEIEK